MFDTRKGTNHDIYDKRLTKLPDPTPGYDYVPRCIYFYYVRFDKNGKVRVDHYFWPTTKPKNWKPILHHTLPARIYELAINARPIRKSAPREKDPPRLKTQNFDPIPWVRKSYIAIFIDEANWRFASREDGRSSVVFNTDEGCANHSFFDAADCVLDMPVDGKPSDKRSALYFINHMKGLDGYDLGEEPEQFKFNLNMTANFVNSSKSGARLQFDPGGTNQGPPEVP